MARPGDLKVGDIVEARFGKSAKFGTNFVLNQGSVGLVYSVAERKVLVDFEDDSHAGRWMDPYELRKLDVIEQLAKLA